MGQVITISREFGSGGREVGILLSKRLKIPFYDKELISMASDASNVCENIVSHYDEHIPDAASLYHATFSSVYEIPMSDQIFYEQSRVMRMLAEKGPCVIVGRCADMILDDSLNLFIHSRIKNRVARIMEMEQDQDPAKIEAKIREIDKKRKEYYQYYTGNTWGKAQNYHLCLDSGKNGVKACLNAITGFLEG